MLSCVEVLYSIALVFLLTWGTDAENCTAAPANPFNATTYYDRGDHVGSFAIGDVALFECLSPGFGYVYLKCLGNDTWTAPHRTCEDSIPVGNGSIVGIAFMVLTFVVTIGALIISHAVTSPEKDEDTTELTCDMDRKAGAYAVNHVSDIEEMKSDDITSCPETEETRLGDADDLARVDHVTTQNGTVKEPADGAMAVEHFRLHSVGSSLESPAFKSPAGSNFINNNTFTGHLVVDNASEEC